MNQLFNQKASDNACRQRSPEHNAVEENIPSPSFLEEQRVSEDEPRQGPDNCSSAGEKSPIHTHSSNEMSVENSDEESSEKDHGKNSVVVSFIVKTTIITKGSILGCFVVLDS